MIISKDRSRVKGNVDFKDIDRQLLAGFECSEFSNDSKKYLLMIREQTNSAFKNRKYWINI